MIISSKDMKSPFHIQHKPLEYSSHVRHTFMFAQNAITKIFFIINIITQIN